MFVPQSLIVPFADVSVVADYKKLSVGILHV